MLLALAALPLRAADKLTVQQLRIAIASAQAAGDSDREIARRIDKITLTERLTDATLAAIVRQIPGTETERELQIQADRSAFLEPPASEQVEAPRPAMEEQRLIIARTIRYTAGFIHGLPDFICTEVIRRLDDDPTRRSDKAEKWKHIRLLDTVVQQLTFNHGQESSVFQMVNGRPYRGKQALSGMVTRGEFGNMLGMMLLGNSDMKAWWSHWEMIDGKRLAVFHYAVDKAHSQYAVSYCCHEIRTPDGRILPSTIIVAFEGELFLDPATGTIYRATWQTVHVPSGFPTRLTSTLVDYRQVDIGGRSYMCPVKSVSVSDSVMYSAIGPFTYPLHSINEARFTQYRKFAADATLMTRRASPSQKAGPSPLADSGSIQVMTPEVTVQPEAPLVLTNSFPGPTSIQGDAGAPEESASVQPLTMFPLPLAPPFDPILSPPADASVAANAVRPIFKEHLNVVIVPVVVRDSQGHAVGNLSKDDFTLFDNRKLQRISGFSVERASSSKPTGAKEPPGYGANETSAVLPDRYVTYLVDDLHLSAGDLQQSRKAAKRGLEGVVREGSRVAVFSTSGTVATGFTDDQAKLEQAWNRILPASHMTGCPNIGYELADRIINGNDRSALAVGIAEAISCGAVMTPRGSSAATMTGPPPMDAQAEMVVKSAARRVLNEQDQESRRVLFTLQTIVRRMAILPGQRTVVFISPGFATSFLSFDIAAAVDRAARNGVVVNTVDARGLYVTAGYDGATRGIGSPRMDVLKGQYDSEEQQLQSNILDALADGTGGTLFENSNDMYGGIERAAARPEVSYILEFTPQEKADGSFHRLSVGVGGRRGLTVEARRGYLAPKHLDDPAKQEKQDLLEAVFSREKLNDLPVTLRTELTKSGINPSQLAVIAHVGIGSISFRKENGRNRDTLTAVMSLFDANGEYVKGLQDKLELDFPNATLAARMASGVSFKNDFDVKAGKYLVRLVLRDEQGQMATADQGVEVTQ